MICCPMTTQIKGYPFEVNVALDADGVVLVDKVKSLDWRARNTKREGAATESELGGQSCGC